MKLIGCVIIAFSLNSAKGKLTESERKKASAALYNVSGITYGGDMMLTQTQKVAMKSRVATNKLSARWPNGEIPYVIDNSLKDRESMINEAANHIRKATNGCIKWFPRTDQKNYVRLYYGNGCWSYVGTVGDGVQDLSLGSGCAYVGTVIHEMLHAVGFHHEQNRPDRDNYLNIYWQNIIDGQSYNFDKEVAGLTYTDFDWDSIMLYGEKAFSVDYEKPTMVDKFGKHKLIDPYDKTEMTSYDAYEVKRFYECN